MAKPYRLILDGLRNKGLSVAECVIRGFALVGRIRCRRPLCGAIVKVAHASTPEVGGVVIVGTSIHRERIALRVQAADLRTAIA